LAFVCALLAFSQQRTTTTTGRSLSIIIPVALCCCRAAAVFALCILSLTIDDILYNDGRLQTAAAKDMTTLAPPRNLQLGAVAIANINLHTQQRGFIFVPFFKKLVLYMCCVFFLEMI